MTEEKLWILTENMIQKVLELNASAYDRKEEMEKVLRSGPCRRIDEKWEEVFMSPITAGEFESLILSIYARDEKEINNLNGGSPMHYCMRVDKCQSVLWKEHRISRTRFLQLFEAFFQAQPVPLYNETRAVSVFGGPSSHFKERNWVFLNGKKYILFKIDLKRYDEMRARERHAEGHK